MGFTLTVTSKSGAMFATGGYGYYNFVLNSTEVFERNGRQKWVAGERQFSFDFAVDRDKSDIDQLS